MNITTLAVVGWFLVMPSGTVPAPYPSVEECVRAYKGRYIEQTKGGAIPMPGVGVSSQELFSCVPAPSGEGQTG